MATGKIHAQTTSRNLIYIAATATGLAVYLHSPVAFGLVIGAVIGHWITPDLDLCENHPIYIQRKLIQKAWLLGWLAYWYWYPYAKLSAHRGRSHSWPLGTAVRLLYLVFPVMILTYVYTLDLTWLSTWSGFIFIGQSLQDVSHLYLDGMLFKRNRKGRGPFKRVIGMNVPKML